MIPISIIKYLLRTILRIVKKYAVLVVICGFIVYGIAVLTGDAELPEVFRCLLS